MEQGIFKAKEAFERCEHISDRAERDLVRHGLLTSLSMLSRKSPLNIQQFYVDLFLFEQVLEAIAKDRETLMVLAQGGLAGDYASALAPLCDQVNKMGLVVHCAEALGYASEIEDEAVRALVNFGLVESLKSILNYKFEAPYAPLDLVVHTWMLEAMFEPTHFIASVASGKEPGSWW